MGYQFFRPCHKLSFEGRQRKKIQKVISVPNKETSSCLVPELPGTGLQTEGGEGSGPPYHRKKSQLEPSRDGEIMERSEGVPIRCVMKEDQQPTE